MFNTPGSSSEGATGGDIPPAPAAGLLPDFSADQIGEAPGRPPEPEHLEPIAFVACSKVHILIVPLDCVDPDIFYAVIRIFLSGWKDNPALPMGLVYEGVSKEPLSYSGGSAAQSTILHAFDEFLGVHHSKESADFLHRMRDYMPPSHRAFVEEIRLAPSLRARVLSSGDGQLLTAYNQCVESLAALRTYHLALVTKYLTMAASKAKAQRTSRLPRPPQALEERGTGGTAVMSFLKSVRDKTLEARLHPGG